jgi:integrase
MWGSIRQLPSGKWQARYPDANGQLHAAPMTFDTKAKANQWLAGTQVDIARGGFVDPKLGEETLDENSKGFITDRVLAQRTRETYQGLLDLHILPTLGNTPIGQITPSAVRGWYTSLHRRHPATAAKSYRLLQTILNTAVADERIARNPCRLDGAGVEATPERPTASVAELEVMAEAMPERLRVVVLLATWCQLRRAELLGLRRKDVDLMRQSVRVEQTCQESASGHLIFKEPKSAAGRRTIAVPPHIIPALSEHIANFVAPEPDAFIVTGEKGGPLRPCVLQRQWSKARSAAGRKDLHLHDLRHTGNTWAAATGASTRELMARMGHSSARAALIYQHATQDRDRVIADALAEMQPLAEVKPIRQRAPRRQPSGSERRRGNASSADL